MLTIEDVNFLFIDYRYLIRHDLTFSGIGAVLQAIYYSRATCEFSSYDLIALLEKARVKNFHQGISGMLVFDQGMFMQVIEGPDDTIAALLDTLLNDKRHNEVHILSTRPITQREFGDWNMAFFQNDRVFEDGYLALSSLDTDLAYATSVAGQLLTMFKDGLFRNRYTAPAGSFTVTIKSGSEKVDTARRQYLINLGNAIASGMPDVPVTVETDTLTPATFNNPKRNLDLGEIEMF